MPAAPAAGPFAGTQFGGFGSTIGVWVTAARYLGTAEAVLREWIERVDASCSRFRIDSDLNRANQAAGTPVDVAPELIDAVIAALEIAEISDGWYDPTVGRAVVAAGYDRPMQVMDKSAPGGLGPAAPAGRWREVAVDRFASTLTVPPATLLDLGGSAKGWAADRALELIRAALGEAAEDVGICVNAGGDLAVAGPAPTAGWPVRVSHSLHGAAGVGDEQVRLYRGSIATSGAVRRTWRIDGRDFHHLINPRTGRPGEEHWRLVTVHAARCAVADPAATVAWLMGADAPAWLDAHGLTARLVTRDGEVRWVGPLTAALTVYSGTPL